MWFSTQRGKVDDVYDATTTKVEGETLNSQKASHISPLWVSYWVSAMKNMIKMNC